MKAGNNLIGKIKTKAQQHLSSLPGGKSTSTSSSTTESTAAAAATAGSKSSTTSSSKGGGDESLYSDETTFLDDDDNDSKDYGDGEIKILLESLDNDESDFPLPEALEKSLSEIVNAVTTPISSNSTATTKRNDDENRDYENKSDDDNNNNKDFAEQARKTLSLESVYGHPLSVEEAKRRMPSGGGGLVWHSLLIHGDPFHDDGTLKPGLNPRDFNTTTRSIKPRRASLPILAQDLYSSLTRIVEEEGPTGQQQQPRYIFHGILNGWPSLQTFELIRIQRRRRQHEFANPVEIFKGERVWAHMWSADQEGRQGIDPSIKEKGLIFRISFQSPPWSREGWSPDSPGFAFWYESQKVPQKSLTYGTNMIESVDDRPICTQVHMIAHRYAHEKENAKDKLTYHSLVLLEWTHQQYCTVIEAAYLNGLAGWRWVPEVLCVH